MKNKHFLLLFLTLFLSLSALLPLAVSANETEKPVIILDPGHGGIDGGTDLGVRLEKTYNLIIAQYLREELLSHGGFEVILTREDDELFQKFYPRAIHLVKHNGDLILSLHCNSSTYDYVNGVEAITSLIEPYAAYDLGNAILAEICEVTGMKNRGVFTRADTGDSLGVYYWDKERNWDMPGASYLGTVSDYFSINTWASKFGASSLIIEHGYLSNSGDRALIEQDEILRKIAKAEAEVLIEYYYGHTHTYTAEKVVDFPSSCTMTGTKSYHCTVCGIKAETEPLPEAADAHFWRQSASAPATCTADGFIEYTCQISHNLSISGHGNTTHTYTEVLPKKEHSYYIYSEENGQRTEICSTCGGTQITYLTCVVHSYEAEETLSPTCTEDGYISYVCTQCKDSYTETLPATGHQPDAEGVCEGCGVDLTPETEPSETEPSETEPPETAPAETSAETSPTETAEPQSCEHSYGDRDICQLCGEERVGERKDLGGLFKNPLFLAAAGIVLVQVTLFAVLIARSRHSTHKSRRRAHTYNKK